MNLQSTYYCCAKHKLPRKKWRKLWRQIQKACRDQSPSPDYQLNPEYVTAPYEMWTSSIADYNIIRIGL